MKQKTILIFLSIFILTFSFVSGAVAVTKQTDNGEITIQPIKTLGEFEKLELQEQEQLREGFEESLDQNREQLQLRYTEKLEENKNLLIYTEDGESQIRIVKMQESITKFEDRFKYRAENVEVYPEGEALNTVILKRQNKFLGLFNVEYEDKYIVDEEGQILEQKRSFWSYMFKRSN